MYPHQLERLSAASAASGVGALVATTPANLLYVTGFRGPVPANGRETERYGVFTPNGTALVVPAAEAVAVALAGVAVDHVRCHGRPVLAVARRADEVSHRVSEWTRECSPNAAEALAAALHALGVSGDRIGVDEGGIGVATWRGLVEHLAGFEIVESAGALAGARRVKGPWEIECLQRALHVAEEAANEVIQTLGPGMTEIEAAATLRDAMLARGGEPHGVVMLFGERSAFPAVAPSDRALRPGELVKLDAGCALKGYQGRLGRTAVAGKPSDDQQRAHDAIQAGLEAALGAVRPGTTVGGLADLVIAGARKAGLPAYDLEQVGHGIGLQAWEPPSVAPGGEARLEAGMVIMLEVPYDELGWGGLLLRDTILVGQEGYGLMNRSARGLVVLD